MKTKLTKVEKYIIALSEDDDNYNYYSCDRHGIFGQHINHTSGLCSYCSMKSEKIENVPELREKYKKELGL